MKCPAWSSPAIEGGVCTVCEEKVGPPPVSISDHRNSIPKPTEVPEQPKTATEVMLTEREAIDLSLQALRNVIMEVSLSPRNSPGKKGDPNLKLKKVGISLPQDLVDGLNDLPGKLVEHVERGMRFYVSVMMETKEGS